MNQGKKIVVFGAGAAGKGLIGVLFSQAGYQVTFVDIKDDLVERLRDAGRYDVLIHRLDGARDEFTVDGFEILHAVERKAVAERMVDADLVMTAVFAQNLPDVAKTISLGVKACRRTNRERPLNIIACENMKKSSSTLAGHVQEWLDDEDRAFVDRLVGFPDCMINRVVPNPTDPLKIETEDYCEWTVETQSVVGAWPADIGFIERVDNQSERLDRKLFVYNGGHAATAYFGHHRGHAWIHEAVADEEVIKLVDGTLNELAAVTQRHHGFSEASMDAYKRDFWLRCRNQGLKDEVARIARQPKRKLGRHERFMAPAKLAEEYGLPRTHIVKAIVAALTYNHPDDPQALELAEDIARDGLRKTLSKTSDLESNDLLIHEIEREYDHDGHPENHARAGSQR